MPTCELRAQAKNAAPDLSQLPSPQELAGKAQGAADDVSGKAKGATDQAVGSASGAAEQAKGSASGAANKVWSKIFFTWSITGAHVQFLASVVAMLCDSPCSSDVCSGCMS